MDFAKLFLTAILVEAIWENLKMVYDKQKININMLGSLVLGTILCILAQIDIFKLVGISLSIPILGSFFTGIICSRGANFVNDLLKKIKGE